MISHVVMSSRCETKVIDSAWGSRYPILGGLQSVIGQGSLAQLTVQLVIESLAEFVKLANGRPSGRSKQRTCCIQGSVNRDSSPAAWHDSATPLNPLAAEIAQCLVWTMQPYGDELVELQALRALT
jgi:hypothetical protein